MQREASLAKIGADHPQIAAAAAGVMVAATGGFLAAGEAIMGAGATALSVGPNIDRLAEEARAVGGNLGDKIQMAGQLVGDVKLGQDAAVKALGSTISKLGGEFGRAAINGTEYLTAARSQGGIVNAIGVNAHGSTFSTALKVGEKGLEVIK
jgi:hypothetical protein